MNVQSMRPSSKDESLSSSARSSVGMYVSTYGVDLSRCVGSLSLEGMDDGWTLGLWDEGRLGQ